MTYGSLNKDQLTCRLNGNMQTKGKQQAEEFIQHSKLAERSCKLLILLSHVGWQMWSGVIIWLYQICQVATLLPPPSEGFVFHTHTPTTVKMD